jgi:predicted  nucleic acid-binding Zn-ribbon protein
MDFTTELDGLQQQVARMKSAMQAATTESREELRQRIDQAQADTDKAAHETQPSAQAQTKWAKMRADASENMREVKARIDKRNQKMDAKAAATEADWAENDALNAIDFAARSLDNARLLMLDAIDGRAYADAQAGGAR